MSANERVKILIGYLKSNKIIRNQQDFVERIENNASVVSEILSNKRGVSEKFVRSINNAFSFISTKWIMTGEGEMIMSEPETIRSIQKNEERTDINRLIETNASLAQSVSKMAETNAILASKIIELTSLLGISDNVYDKTEMKSSG